MMYIWTFFYNRAVDGNLEAMYWRSSCTHTMYSSSPWLVIDLQGNYAITHVKIKNREDCWSKYILMELFRLSETMFSSLFNAFKFNIGYVV